MKTTKKSEFELIKEPENSLKHEAKNESDRVFSSEWVDEMIRLSLELDSEREFDGTYENRMIKEEESEDRTIEEENDYPF